MSKTSNEEEKYIYIWIANREEKHNLTTKTNARIVIMTCVFSFSRWLSSFYFFFFFFFFFAPHDDGESPISSCCVRVCLLFRSMKKKPNAGSRIFSSFSLVDSVWLFFFSKEKGEKRFVKRWFMWTWETWDTLRQHCRPVAKIPIVIVLIISERICLRAIFSIV